MISDKDGALGAIPGSRASTEPSVPLSRPVGFDPGRVLFLDIDGVVLSAQDLYATNNQHLPPHKLALVKEVCDRASAYIVVSSTWRYSDDTADRLRFAGLPLHPNWRTPRTEGAQTRGHDIHRWLARNPVAAYAIVDDDSDMLPEQMARFVKTPFQTGIDREHVERLVAILASAGEAGTATTVQQGVVHEHATGAAGDAQPPSVSPLSSEEKTS